MGLIGKTLTATWHALLASLSTVSWAAVAATVYGVAGRIDHLVGWQVGYTSQTGSEADLNPNVANRNKRGAQDPG